jgi:dTDP-4-amino-4,6-dideoxygalactose transaminase
MIRLSKSIVGYKESEAVQKVINESGYLGMGAEVSEFEIELELFIGNPKFKCVCVSSGTAALHLALEAITNYGDEVLVPSLTYVASYQAITAAGCIPVSCDVDKNTLLIDLEDAKNRITSKTKVIMPVHYASNTSNLNDVYSFAKKNNLRIVEDAAHAFGCIENKIQIGAQGDIICFSFDGIKNITSGEGGAIFTNDINVLNKCKDSRLLGVIKDTEARFKGERSWEFDVTSQGYRYHMSNIFAAIGRVQLKRFISESFGTKRKDLATTYVDLLKNNKNIRLINIDYKISVPHIFPILVNNELRHILISDLKKQNIQYGLHYKPNHLLTKYKEKYSLPICETYYDELLTLPLHPDLKISDVELICKILNKYK